ncbi:unnamed protein product [Plutella xylostella]|uniref:(diamondback moth) hypothetical protein n=1 Tax=Plutella xylostella TaxID=51655 RepID=A0A8S4FYA2_PLUXY|nr:unnamed protein product [Plutella xylostella]
MSPQNLKIDDIYYHPEESDDNTEKVISMQRLEIASEYYKSNFKARSEFEDLLLEKGGEPVRSLIITGYRSGSQFLSFILSAVPGNFHFNEPLMQFKGTETIQIPPTQANDANMKVTRLRLRYIEDILQDKDFSKLRAVLLVRDPRAVLRSRRPLPWCGPYRDCWDPALVCRAMVSDHRALVSLQDKFPNRLTAVRFEDLALNSSSEAKRLFHALGRPLGAAVQEFLREHTNSSRDLSPYSTFRVSRDVPFKWKEELDYKFVSQIQESCVEAMQLWGYRRAHSLQHLRSSHFMPLGAYSLH